MLSETFVLRQALERAGLQIPGGHPRVKTPGRSTGPCLRVRLDNQGHAITVEAVTEEEWRGLWTVMEGNQNSFPVVRIKEPLFDVPRSSDIWRKLGFDDQGRRKKSPDNTIRLSVLTDVLTSASQRFSKKSQSDWQRLRRKSSELLEHTNSDDAEHAALRELGRCFKNAANNPKALLREIADRAVQGVQQARLDALDTVEALLVGKRIPARGQRPQMTIQLAFDLDDDHSFPRRLYSQQIREHVKRILPTEQEKPRNEHPAPACAYTGEALPLQLAAFPKVKLPVLNKEFPLVSMFRKAACNKRYGLTDARVVPVAKEVALRMQSALTWIVADERKGKTWRAVANGKFETAHGRKRELYDLLVVYVDGKPEIDAHVADLFGTDERQQRKQFEVDAQAVCEALDGVERERPGSRLNLFLLRKASEGQAHIAVAESPLVREVLAAARWWQQASANVPDVVLPLPGEKGQRSTQGRPRAPYPDQVVRLLSEEWVTNGTRSNKAYGIGLGEVLGLMLRKPGEWEPGARRILDLTVRRLAPLLLGVSGAMHAQDVQRWDDYPVRSREIVLRAVSLLGILLDAIGQRKETYMSGVAFSVGRLLSLSDTLHREYCKRVRGGSIPPQLIGNALMPAAADNPENAVDRLRERMTIYKAWADKGDGEEYRLAKWAVGQMGQVCHHLAQLHLPTETDQAFRAELFLGYLARPPGEKGQVSEIDPTKEETDAEPK